MSDSTELDARFGNGAALPPSRPAGQATQIEQARAVAEVRAAIMVAMEQPRNLSAAINEMREVCGIMALAERAFFRVPRGGEHVNGESIHLARELARVFGNISYGVKELARDDIRGQSELVAYCWDMQHNTRSEINFIVPHTRGKSNKRLTGIQEIYENNASFAGRRLRETIFAVLPVWFRAEAAEICHETLAKGGGKPLVQRIADLRTAFEAVGVTAAQLERKRGRKVDNFLPEDVAGLRVVYGSIKRGEVTIADEFPTEEQVAAANRPVGDKLGALESVVVAETGDTQEEVTFADDTETADANKTDPAQPSLLANPAASPLFVPLPRIKAPKTDWQHYARQVEHVLTEGHPGAEIAKVNADGISSLRTMAPDEHRALVAALGGA